MRSVLRVRLDINRESAVEMDNVGSRWYWYDESIEGLELDGSGWKGDAG